MNTALYLLRATQLHLSMDDLEQLSIGIVFDMSTESANDDYDWPIMATQEDMNAFAGIDRKKKHEQN